MAVTTTVSRFCGRPTSVLLVLSFFLMSLCRVESVVFSKQLVCSGRYVCQGRFQCIDYKKICDGIQDCPFGDDEMQCSCLSDDDCQEEASCVPVDDESKICKRECPRGMKNINGRCVDEDECSSGNHNCSTTEQCINTLGSFRCDCRTGYARNNSTNVCDDIDECKGPDIQCTSPLCKNLPGSFECLCPEHTDLIRSFDFKTGGIILGCSTMNYCRNSSCEAPRVCEVNLSIDKKYQCVCPTGYLDQNGTCVDTDECLAVGNICDRVVRTSDTRLRCHNMAGNYACRCRSSTKAVVIDNYVFVDKCALTERVCGSTNCPKNSSCKQGICICEPGYLWNNRRCVDLDECAYNAHDCPDGMVCINESPGYSCACQPGFRLESIDGTAATNETKSANYTTLRQRQQCVDIDECKEGVAECEHTCENNNGSYICHCPEGHVRIDRNCYPSQMPRQIIQFEKNLLRFGTLGFDDLSIHFDNYSHSCDKGHPTGLAYDQKHHKIFYLSSDRSSIFRDIYLSPCETLVDGRTNIADIAIDYEFENIYWIEGGDLYVKSVLGGRELHLKSFNDTLRSIMVDPAESYAAVVGDRFVYKVDLDGSSAEALYENLNISQIFRDADGSPVYSANDILISCPSIGAPWEDCVTLNIPTRNKRILGVYMNFILLINERNLLEVISENTRNEFLLRIEYTNETLFEIIQTPKTLNLAHSCRYCNDICLNSGSTSERCMCAGSPCGPTVFGSLKAYVSVIGWQAPLFMIPVVLLAVVILIVMRRFKKAKCVVETVGFYSNAENVIVESAQSVTPCIDVCMKSQLIVNQ